MRYVLIGILMTLLGTNSAVAQELGKRDLIVASGLLVAAQRMDALAASECREFVAPHESYAQLQGDIVAKFPAEVQKDVRATLEEYALASSRAFTAYGGVQALVDMQARRAGISPAAACKHVVGLAEESYWTYLEKWDAVVAGQ